ncbi:MAG: glycosyltransferase family 2 protein [Chryseobacterium sp.]|nr:MAG: glycosyltransferase family 2 protein [Chryseobacterium sp.]
MSQQYSLLIPVYNASPFIAKFIEHLSLLKKPFDEVIFYDDASTDNTVEILTGLGMKVIGGRVNLGPAHARNSLIQEAKFDWIHFHDVDDFMSPDYLAKASFYADLNIYDVIICDVDWYDSQTRKLVLSWHYKQAEINRDPLIYTIGHPVGGINGLYRRSTLKQIGGFNSKIRIWEDADLHVRLAGNADARFYVVEESLCYAYRYPNSASTDQKKAWSIRLDLLREYYNAYSDPSTRLEIGAQAQVAAGSLLLSGEIELARRALYLSELCKLKVPIKNNLPWRLFKTVLPSQLRVELRLIHLKIAFRKQLRLAN